MVRWNKAYIKGTKTIIKVDDKLPLKTEYVCIAYGADMIAKRGKERVHHFAHKNTVCNPESYFHKMAKELFKELYDSESKFIIKSKDFILDLKTEYNDKCEIEENKRIKGNADILIKHSDDRDKDIFIEILYTHSTDVSKMNKGFPIIEINISTIDLNEDIDDEEIINKIKEIISPPLIEEKGFIRFLNLPEKKIYIKKPINKDPKNNRSLFDSPSFYDEDQSLCTKSKRDFKSVSTDEEKSLTTRRNVNQSNWSYSKNKYQKSHSWIINPSVRVKYENIRHQPAVLPNYKPIIDIITRWRN